MSRLLPGLTLALMLLAALLTLAAGLRLAREERQVRVPRDRGELSRFAASMRHELQRLEAVYERHLHEAALKVEINDSSQTVQVCENIVGIDRCSFLSPPARGRPDAHVEVKRAAQQPPFQSPYLTFRPIQTDVSKARLLPWAEVFDETAPEAGWFMQTGLTAYWLRRNASFSVVLTLDLEAVRAAVSSALGENRAGYLKAVQSGMAGRWSGPEGVVLAGAGTPPKDRPADFIEPLHSRLGTWQIESWDTWVTAVRHDPATITWSAAGALLLGFTGLGAYVHQRRSLRLAQQRVSFVNNVSHELRTPLTNILLNLDLAADALEEGGSEAAARLHLVRDEAGRLARLIDNVLTFSRRDQGRLRLEIRICRVEETVRAVVAQFAPLLARRGITLETRFDGEPEARTDPDALAQIVANLLSNVEKYAPNGAAALSCDVRQGLLTLTVSDEGPGIPGTAAERIFQPFERLHSQVSEGAAGTGLGLPIARELARQMGGDLRLLPSAKGAVFELRIPSPS